MSANPKKLILVAASALLIAGVSALATADVPGDKKVIKIDVLEGKKGAVAFEHGKHAAEYKKAGGKAIACNDCHHTVKAASPDPKTVKACADCHVAEGAAQKEHGGKKAPFLGTQKKPGTYDNKSIIFHGNCIPCHEKVKVDLEAAGKEPIHKCKTCHK